MRLGVKTFLKRLILSFLLFFCVMAAHAQNSNRLVREGSKFYEKGNHRAAVKYFEQAISEEPNLAIALYLAGISYMTFDKEKAADYLYRAYEIDPEVDVDVLYWLGRAEHVNYNFDKAIEHFKNYQKTLPKREEYQFKLAEAGIQHARNAKHEISNPKDIFVRNLGPAVNSIYSEHSPAISSDDNYLVFTSRGKGVTGGKESGDGEYFEDIFETTRLGPNDWRAVRAVPGSLNGPGHEACIQLFDNDTKMLLYSSVNYGDIMVSEREPNGSWGTPKSISDKVNSKYYESDAYITPDGKTLFFSTNQFNKASNLDIYKVEKLSNGEWSEPKSLGNVINTPYDEDSPFLAGDGTLYFASRGHNTMGGYDIFKTRFDAATNQWTKPENMGVPINSPDDDTYYRLSHDGRYAYLSSYRIGGYGEKDIYTVTFQNAAHIAGQVFSKHDSSAIAGVELRFKATKADKQPLYYQNEIKNLTDNYAVDVLAGLVYQVEIIKDKKVIGKQEIKVPSDKNKTVSMVSNFYVDYGSFKKEEPPVVIAAAKEPEKPVVIPEPEKLIASLAEKPVTEPPVVEEVLEQPVVVDLQKSVNTAFKPKPRAIVSTAKVKPVRVAKVPVLAIALEPEEPELIAVVEKPAEVIPEKPVVVTEPEKPIVAPVTEKPVIAAVTEKPATEKPAVVAEKPVEVKPEEKKAEPVAEKPALAIADRTATTKPAAQPVAAARDAKKPIGTGRLTTDIDVDEEEEDKTIAFESIFYDVGSYELRPASIETLDRIVEMMNQDKEVRVKVEGYTMVQVVSNYSRNLSRNRAKSAYDYLIKKGISPSRLVLSTYNNKRALAANTTAESMQKNRMTRFVVIPKETR